MKKLNLDVVVVVFLVVSNETFGSHELYSSALLYKNKLNVVVCKQIVFFNIHI